MTDKHYERKSAESGSGSIMALVCILVVSVLVFIFLGYFKMHQVATRMQIAADLASLAGAGVMYDYVSGRSSTNFSTGSDTSSANRSDVNFATGSTSPCAIAKDVARANDIVLSACYMQDNIVYVKSKRKIGVFEINIVSKAGL